MRRRVYFAFHYDDVINFRANVVRNHGALSGSEKAGFFDASIWEEAKKTSSLALKRMINSEINGTTVTCVLIGSQTFDRKWVKYEVFKSLERGNKILGVHINGVRGKDGFIKQAGPDPFLYLAVKRTGDTTYQCLEYVMGSWRVFSELPTIDTRHVSGIRLLEAYQLSQFSTIRVHDWVNGEGHINFASWIA